MVIITRWVAGISSMPYIDVFWSHAFGSHDKDLYVIRYYYCLHRHSNMADESLISGTASGKDCADDPIMCQYYHSSNFRETLLRSSALSCNLSHQQSPRVPIVTVLQPTATISFKSLLSADLNKPGQTRMQMLASSRMCHFLQRSNQSRQMHAKFTFCELSDPIPVAFLESFGLLRSFTDVLL
jgi:hypothetical protein